MSTCPFGWTGGPPPFGSPTAIQPSGIEGGAFLCPVPGLNGPRIKGTTTHSPTRPITAKYSPAPPPRAKGGGDYWASQAFPLRSVWGEFQYWPFSASDLYNWKTHNPPFSQDPQALTGLIESILLTLQPTWDDCQQLLQALLTTEERQRVFTEARKNVLGDDGRPTQLPNEIDEVFPLTRPNWDFNTAAGRERLRLYRQVLLTGLRGAGRRPTNLAKVRAIVQGSEETPAGFLERLMEGYRMYTPFDPQAPDRQADVIMSFIGQSAPDIRTRLQRLEGLQGYTLPDLVKEAEKIYNKRETKEEREERVRREQDQRDRKRDKQLVKVLATIVAGSKTGRDKGRQDRDQGDKRRPRVERDQCAYCKERGHWARDCPNKGRPRPQQRTAPVFSLEDDE
nr:uncharacterized protein LOC127485291 [Oryctolagus cuniculus]